jgi:hypothetical protein
MCVVNALIKVGGGGLQIGESEGRWMVAPWCDE